LPSAYLSLFFLVLWLTPCSTFFPYTTLFRSVAFAVGLGELQQVLHRGQQPVIVPGLGHVVGGARLHQLHRRFEVCPAGQQDDGRSEEHTSELQSRENLVCRLLLEKTKLHPHI